MSAAENTHDSATDLQSMAKELEQLVNHQLGSRA
jgi:hypothetical protein